MVPDEVSTTHYLNGRPPLANTLIPPNKGMESTKKEAATKAAVNPLANLKGKVPDRLCSSNIAKAAPTANYKVYDVMLQAKNGRLFSISGNPRQTSRSNCHPSQGEAGTLSGFATMRSTIRTVPSDVGSQDANGRPMSEGKLEVPKRPPTNLMIGPNNHPQHPGDLLRQRPDLLPPSRGHHRQQVPMMRPCPRLEEYWNKFSMTYKRALIWP